MDIDAEPHRRRATHGAAMLHDERRGATRRAAASVRNQATGVDTGGSMIGGDIGGTSVGSGTSLGEGSVMGDGPGIGSGEGDGVVRGSGVMWEEGDSMLDMGHLSDGSSMAGSQIVRPKEKRGFRPFSMREGFSDP